VDLARGYSLVGKIVVDPGPLQRLFGQRAVNYTERRMNLLKEACQAECPVGDREYVDAEGDHPGALKESHYVTRVGYRTWLLVVGARYGIFVYDGRAPEGARKPNRWLDRGKDRLRAENLAR
jgi:hypothetical protein